MQGLAQCGLKCRDSGINTRITLIRDSDSDSIDTLGIVDQLGAYYNNFTNISLILIINISLDSAQQELQNTAFIV